MKEQDYYEQFGLFWYTTTTDLRKCSNCGEAITGIRWVLGYSKEETFDCDYTLCQNCKDLEK